MPRLAGVNLVAVLAGAVAMYFIGFVIYGLALQEVWTQQLLENHGVVAPGEGAKLTGDALLEAAATIPQQLDMGVAMGLGFVISLVTSFGVAFALALMKPATLAAALMRAGMLWLGFQATTLAYNVVYYAESTTNFGIDLVHTLVGVLVAAALIFVIDGRAISGASPAASNDA